MKGLGVSRGIGIGKVLKIEQCNTDVTRQVIQNIDEEILKLENAVKECKKQIKLSYDYTIENVGTDEAEIFRAHEMILEDDAVFDEIRDRISNESINCEFALYDVFDRYIRMLENIEDEYLRDRAKDIRDIMQMLLKIMMGGKAYDFSNIEEGTVLVAYDLTPSDTAQIDKNKVSAIVVEIGGRTSHVAIIARTMDIPTVVGVDGIFNAAFDGDMLYCDGNTGQVDINPDENTKKLYAAKQKREIIFNNNLKLHIGLDSMTQDGFKVRLEANIGVPADVEYALKNDAEAIGLFRSEFLYMSRDKLPTEEEQFEVYKNILQKMNGRPVVIRTLDVGGDKEIPYLKIPKEANPFLGYRAIRLCLDNTDIFKTQLRAVLRASVYGNTKILFPMISGLEELRDVKKLYFETKQELIDEGYLVSDDIELGIMIEIPSAAEISDLLAKEVDFFSIGTNDLIQYTLAVDRMNSKINHLYNQYHPAIIRTIKKVIENAHAANICVSMCGEMAGEPSLIPILIGMGLDEFSMSPSSILMARCVVRNRSREKCEEMLNKVLELDTAEKIEQYLLIKSCEE